MNINNHNNKLSISTAWYLINIFDQTKRIFLTTNQTSKFIFIGKSSDSDIQLVKNVFFILIFNI